MKAIKSGKNVSSTNSNIKMDAIKIIERICKGIEFLMLTDAQKQEQRNYVAATVYADLKAMSEKDFALKYVEWIPTSLTAQAVGINDASVRSEIERRTKAQNKLVAPVDAFQHVWIVNNLEKGDHIMTCPQEPTQEALANVETQIGGKADVQQFMLIPVNRIFH